MRPCRPCWRAACTTRPPSSESSPPLPPGPTTSRASARATRRGPRIPASADGGTADCRACRPRHSGPAPAEAAARGAALWSRRLLRSCGHGACCRHAGAGRHPDAAAGPAADSDRPRHDGLPAAHGRGTGTRGQHPLRVPAGPGPLRQAPRPARAASAPPRSPGTTSPASSRRSPTGPTAARPWASGRRPGRWWPCADSTSSGHSKASLPPTRPATSTRPCPANACPRPSASTRSPGSWRRPERTRPPGCATGRCWSSCIPPAPASARPWASTSTTSPCTRPDEAGEARPGDCPALRQGVQGTAGPARILRRPRPGRLPRPRPAAAGRQGQGDPGPVPERPRRTDQPAERLDHPQDGRGEGQHHQGRLAAHPAALLRHAPARGRGRRPGGAGTAGPRLRDHHAGLHPGHGGHPAGDLRRRASAGAGLSRQERSGAPLGLASWPPHPSLYVSCSATQAPGTEVLLGLKRTGFGTGKIVGIGGHVEAGESDAEAVCPRSLGRGRSRRPAGGPRRCRRRRVRLSHPPRVEHVLPALHHAALGGRTGGEPRNDPGMVRYRGAAAARCMWQDAEHWLPAGTGRRGARRRGCPERGQRDRGIGEKLSGEV